MNNTKENNLSKTAQVVAPYIVRTGSGGIAVVTLNRPTNRNALSSAMIESLQIEFDSLATDPNVRVIILRAEGPGFCAGHDLKEIQERRVDQDKGQAFFQKLFADCTKLMTSITALPQPVIAEIQGIATAAGTQLVATCDIAIASDVARFGVNGIDVGFFCSTPMVALSRNIGRKLAMELLTTGDMMTAQKAMDAGLVNQVVARDKLQGATMAMARKIAAKPKNVLALGKKAFQAQIQMPRQEAYQAMEKVMVQNLMLEESVEGFAAFIEKRAPKWTD